jgi:hypothetical protein
MTAGNIVPPPGNKKALGKFRRLLKQGIFLCNEVAGLVGGSTS